MANAPPAALMFSQTFSPPGSPPALNLGGPLPGMPPAFNPNALPTNKELKQEYQRGFNDGKRVGCDECGGVVKPGLQRTSTLPGMMYEVGAAKKKTRKKKPKSKGKPKSTGKPKRKGNAKSSRKIR